MGKAGAFCGVARGVALIWVIAATPALPDTAGMTRNREEGR